MKASLSAMFIEHKGKPLNIDGNQVVMSHKVEVVKNQEVRIELISWKSEYRQGIEVSLDTRKGMVEVNGEKLSDPIFWTDSAPRCFAFKCHPRKAIGHLNILNIWQHRDSEGRIDAWVGNAGIIIHQEEEGSFLFSCSNGIGEVHFDDIVFRIRVR